MSKSVAIVKEAALAAQSALRQHPNDLPLLRVAAASHALAGIWQTHKEPLRASANSILHYVSQKLQSWHRVDDPKTSLDT